MASSNSLQDQHFNVHHKGHVTHDAIAGAAAYEAIKSYNDHVSKNGQPVNHAAAKEIFGGLLAAGLTRLIETKGLDAWDAQKRKKVQQQAEQHFQDAVLNRN